MAYRLKPDETLQAGARRIARRLIDRILARSPDHDAAWFHESRKGLKRLRALLRLVRSGLPDGVWTGANTELRDIGRLLADRREADVRAETIASLRAGAGKPLADALDRLAPSKPSKMPARVGVGNGRDGLPGAGAAASQAGTRLERLREALAHLDIDGGAGVIEAGLVRTHRAGRRAVADLAVNGSDEVFHELRKAVQLHWRQMQLLAEAWPGLMKARVAAARDVSQLLGRDHDLALLAAFADRRTANGPTARQRAAIIAACRAEQAALRPAAILEAQRLFREKPRVFAAEVAGCWRLTQCAAEAAKAQSVAMSQRKGAAHRPQPSKSARRGTGAPGGVEAKRSPTKN